MRGTDDASKDDASRDGARRARLPRAVVAAVCAALVTAALAVAGPGGAWAMFTGTTATPGNELTTRSAFPDYRTAVQESTPVVYHPFDDPYGSTSAAALAGSTGTYNGAAAASSVPSGAISASAGGPRRAVAFPANAYAAANETTSLVGGVGGGAGAGDRPRLTLEAWVRTGQGGAVVSLLPEGSPTQGRTQLYVNARGQVCVGLTLDSGGTLQEVCGYDAADPKAWTSTDQASPSWHHIAAVIDPSALPGSTLCGSDGTQVVVYVDGAVVYDRGLCGTWPATVAGRLRVGTAPIPTDVITTADPAADQEGPAPDTWSGDIDEVAVYAAALPAAEVKKHYDLGKGTVAGNYATSVRGFPSLQVYWQLEDQPTAAARTVADSSPAGTRVGTFRSYPDLEVTGAPTGAVPADGIAVGLSGVGDISTGAVRTTPTAFSTEVWFNSSGGTGPLASFGATSTGTATVPDLAVHLTADGHLAYTVRSPQRTLVSGVDHRDGAWHLVTATMSASGRMRLYVDGVQVQEAAPSATASYTGFWRWGGGGDYSGFATKPGAAFFTGRLDEASVYDRELSPEEVAVHWGAKF